MRRLSVLFALTAFVAMGAAPARRADAFGDPLPEDAIARLGTTRFRSEGSGLALSPDGKLLADGRGLAIRLLDTSTGKVVRTSSLVDFSISCDDLHFSPDGKFLAVEGQSAVVLIDLNQDKVVRHFKLPFRRVFLSFSVKGGMLAIGGADYDRKLPVSLYDGAGKKVKTIATTYDRSVRPLLSPDGKLLAVWGSSQQQKDPVVELWDVNKDEKPRTLSLAGNCTGAAFSPDGTRLAVLETGSSLSFWDVQKGKELNRVATRRDTILAVYSPDGKILATGSEGGVQLWDTAEARRIASCDSPANTGLHSVAFLANNKVLAAGRCWKALRLWEVPSSRERTPTGGHVETVYGLAFSRDGKTLLSFGGGVRTWATDGWKELRRFVPRADTRHGGPYYDLSPHGQYFLWTTEGGGGYQVVEASSGQEIAEVRRSSPNGRRSANTFSADGWGWVVLDVSYAEKPRAAVRVWNLATGRQRRTIHFDAPGGDSVIAASSGAKLLALVSVQDRQELTIRLGLYDLTNGTRILGKKLDTTRVASATFSPDGGTIALCGDGIHLLDVVTGERVRRLLAGQSAEKAVFSPDGRLLAVCSGNEGEVVLWELASGKVRARYAGHRGGTKALAFSPDSKLLATGGEDTTVLLWDVTGHTRFAAVEPKDAETLWTDLDADDAARVYKAMARLTASPKAAVALFAKRLKPAAGRPLGEKEVKRLIDALGDESFDARQKASVALKKAGRALRPALLARRSDADLEIRRRVNELLAAMARSATDRATLRDLRAVEVLERLGTPEARRLLAALAKGNPDVRLTADAAASLKRLRARR